MFSKILGSDNNVTLQRPVQGSKPGWTVVGGAGETRRDKCSTIDVTKRRSREDSVGASRWCRKKKTRANEVVNWWSFCFYEL